MKAMKLPAFTKTRFLLLCGIVIALLTVLTFAYLNADGEDEVVTHQSTFTEAPGRELPDTLHGVTTESVEDLPSLSAALKAHHRRPTVRIVFQQGMQPQYYEEAVSTLRANSYVMGQILDSTALSDVSASEYQDRTRDFVDTFGRSIDIYEIGNELNGEWVGEPAETYEKVQAAYDVVEKENADLDLRSAITLNYWPSSDCYMYDWEDTLRYARDMPAEVRNGTDYLLLSFYETACSPQAYPTNQNFIAVFSDLAELFPNAQLGMGEIGARGTVDGLPEDPTIEDKARIADRYYGMHQELSDTLGERYAGGYFWWYYYQDAVPYSTTNGMWPVLERNFNSY